MNLSDFTLERLLLISLSKQINDNLILPLQERSEFIVFVHVFLIIIFLVVTTAGILIAVAGAILNLFFFFM